SKTLPWRTLPMPAKPNAPSAPSMALPWGSRTPFFRVTVTRAFIDNSSRDGSRNANGRLAAAVAINDISLHENRPAALRPLLLLGQDAETARDFLIGLDEAAHVAAETVLVQLVLGLHVPEPARIRRD